MGGYGSGRWYRESKKTTSNCFQLDVRFLKRKNLLHGVREFSLTWPDKQCSIGVNVDADRLHLHFVTKSYSGDVLNVNQYVSLTWTDCRFGGKRVWFLCPIESCGRRVAMLYGTDKFACRHCQNLVYASQKSSAKNRDFMRADVIRRKLGWKPGVAYGVGAKPKGMHTRKYWKVLHKYLTVVDRIMGQTQQEISKYH